MDERRARALQASFWSKLAPELAEAVFRDGIVVDLAAGRVIEDETRAGNVGLVLDGLFRLYVRSKTGRQATVRYARTGDMIGLTSLLAGPCQMGIQALSAGSMLGIPGATLRDHALADVRIAWALAQDSAQRTYELAEEVAGNTFGTVRQRVARHLLDLVVGGDGDRLLAPISQQDLANAVGTVREVVSRVLQTLKGEGLLQLSADGVEILDATELYVQSTG